MTSSQKEKSRKTSEPAARSGRKRSRQLNQFFGAIILFISTTIGLFSAFGFAQAIPYVQNRAEISFCRELDSNLSSLEILSAEIELAKVPGDTALVDINKDGLNRLLIRNESLTPLCSNYYWFARRRALLTGGVFALSSIGVLVGCLFWRKS